MAMTAQVKAELAEHSVTKSCCRKAEVAVDAAVRRRPAHPSGRIVVEAELDTGAAARRIRRDIVEIYGHQSDVVDGQGDGSARAPGTSSGWSRTARRWPARPGCSTAAAVRCAGCRRRSSPAAAATRWPPGAAHSWPTAR